MSLGCNIQMKICAEYRDMLPKPRLVCQASAQVYLTNPAEAWVACPGKTAQILICFIAYMFLSFYSSVGLVGNFGGLQPCTVPSAIVHCNQNEAGHQTIKTLSMPWWNAAGPLKHSPWVWLGTLQDCNHAQCPLPLCIVIRMRLVIRQSKLSACLGEMQLAH